MPNGPMRIVKTLVIGLGSTGTQICDQVAERVEWELGELRRAPWVRFLCVETNVNQESRLRESGDFLTLTMSPRDYEQVLTDPAAYDEKVLLSQWADLDTLRKLPGMEVAAGAGNIRMVGRLAFLYEANYNRAKRALRERINSLRALTAAQATEHRGPLADGSNPDVDFGADGHLRVMVVGTLCGGTCGGLVSDFGYFLRSLCAEDEELIGLFTVPHPELTSALEPAANRYKRNAYCALAELNHYHLAGREHEAPIRYPDGVVADTHAFPWDIPFLAMPRQADRSSVDELNRALADRIFLNILVPQTDPFAETIDATIFDREHRAHAFCSFGLSSVEFPAHQVIQACAKRILAYALRDWQSRALEPDELEARLQGLALTWPRLRALLVQAPGGESLERQLEQKTEEVVRLARSDMGLAERSLDELRSAFFEGEGGAEGVLGPGSVPRAIRDRRAAAAEEVLDRLRRHVGAKLLNYHEGPAPMRQLLRAAKERLQELHASDVPTYEPQIEDVSAAFARLGAYHRSPLLRLTMLRPPAINDALPELREALREEIGARLDGEVVRALQTTRTREGEDPGVLDRADRLLSPVVRRLDNLNTRLTRLITDLNREWGELARNPPPINGLCIFEASTAAGGTVETEFQRCLVDWADDPAVSWQTTRDKVSAEITGAWEGLPEAVVPRTTRGIRDWLLEDFSPHSTREAIPRTDLSALMSKARQPFLRVKDVDVLERWTQRENAQLDAREAAGKARPFLDIDPALAERGGRSAVQTRRTVLVPPHSAHRDEFWQSIRPVVSEAEVTDSPDRFRAVVLEEWYRFPLSGAPDVLGRHGLHTAQCTDFPTFQTRSNIFWAGLSDEEVDALREAEEVIVVGMLIGVLEAKRGHIVLKTRPVSPADPGERRLPLDFRGAVRLLAREERDVDSWAVSRQLVKERIEGHRRTRDGDSQEERDRAFVQELTERLRASMGVSVPGWEMRMADRLVTRYCGRDRGLFNAFNHVFPPDEAKIRALHRRKGEALAKGAVAPEDGLYCSECGGLIGRNVEDAAAKGWECYVNPQHYFGVYIRASS